MTTSTDVVLRLAAQACLTAADAYHEASAGRGHADQPHNRDFALVAPTVDACSACAGAQYGTEDTLQGALGDLREALGHERKANEYHRG